MEIKADYRQAWWWVSAIGCLCGALGTLAAIVHLLLSLW
jgi:hypothetical protein